MPELPATIDVLNGSENFRAYCAERGCLMLRPAYALPVSMGKLAGTKKVNYPRLGKVIMGLYECQEYPYPVAVFFDPETGARIE